VSASNSDNGNVGGGAGAGGSSIGNGGGGGTKSSGGGGGGGSSGGGNKGNNGGGSYSYYDNKGNYVGSYNTPPSSGPQVNSDGSINIGGVGSYSQNGGGSHNGSGSGGSGGSGSGNTSGNLGGGGKGNNSNGGQGGQSYSPSLPGASSYGSKSSVSQNVVSGSSRSSAPATTAARYSAPPGSAGAAGRTSMGGSRSQPTSFSNQSTMQAAMGVPTPTGGPSQGRSRPLQQSQYQNAPTGGYGPRAGAGVPGYMQAQNIPGMDVGQLPAPGWERSPPGQTVAKNDLGNFNVTDIPKNDVTRLAAMSAPNQIVAKNNVGETPMPHPSIADTVFGRYANDSLPPGYRDRYLNNDERILAVEDVPPEPVAAAAPPPEAGPPPGYAYDENPIQYDPKKTWQGKALKMGVDAAMRFVPGFSLATSLSKHYNQGLTPGELAQRDLDGYLGMSPQQQAAYGDRADARRSAQTDRENNTNRTQIYPDWTPGVANAYLPPPPAAPPPPEETGIGSEANDSWAQRTRAGNPADPYSYGFGPGYNYFYYS